MRGKCATTTTTKAGAEFQWQHQSGMTGIIGCRDEMIMMQADGNEARTKTKRPPNTATQQQVFKLWRRRDRRANKIISLIDHIQPQKEFDARNIAIMSETEFALASPLGKTTTPTTSSKYPICFEKNNLDDLASASRCLTKPAMFCSSGEDFMPSLILLSLLSKKQISSKSSGRNIDASYDESSFTTRATEASDHRTINRTIARQRKMKTNYQHISSNIISSSSSSSSSSSMNGDSAIKCRNERCCLSSRHSLALRCYGWPSKTFLYLFFLTTITITLFLGSSASRLPTVRSNGRDSDSDNQQTKLSNNNFHHHDHHQDHHHHHQNGQYDSIGASGDGGSGYSSEQYWHRLALASRGEQQEPIQRRTSRLDDDDKLVSLSYVRAIRGHDSAGDLTLPSKDNENSQSESTKGTVQCNRLTILWRYLESTYPALAEHLMQWAASKQQMHSRVLNEADRLLHGPKQETNSSTTPTAISSWLERVRSNPSYARLVDHMRSKLQHKHSSAQTKAAAEQRLATPSVADAPAAERGDQHVTYGRPVLYPHELGAGISGRQPQQQQETSISASGSPLNRARTLDKLHLLDHRTRLSAKQQQQQQIHEALHSNLIEKEQQQQSQPATRNIDSLPSEIEQMTANDWRKLDESATDAARNNYVYGNVKFAPDQVTGPRLASRLADRQHQLQMLAAGSEPHSQHEHNKLVASALDEADQNGAAAAASVVAGHHHPIGSRQRPADLSFGRVVSNPSAARSRGAFNTKWQPGTTIISTPKDNDKVDLSASMEAGISNTDEDGHNDELSGQQRAAQFSVEGDGGEAQLAMQQKQQPDLLGDEFEGHFHSGPLDQIAVRELRSSSSNEVEDTSNNVVLISKADQQSLSLRGQADKEHLDGLNSSKSKKRDDDFVVDR